MTKLHRVALLCLPLFMLLWGGDVTWVHGEDEKPEKPAADEPDAPPADDPAPTPEEPKGDEPKDDPKDEPKPDPNADPDAPNPKGKVKGLDEEPAALPPEPPKVKKGEITVPATTWPALPEGVKPGPAGTVFLPGGEIVIGTKSSVLSKLIDGRPPEQRALFMHEAPADRVYVEPVYFGRFELSNAQYRRFMDDFVKEYDTGSGGLGTIDRIVSSVWHVTDKEKRSVKYKLWRQFYEANKAVIWEAFKKNGKLNALVVRRPGGDVDEDKTARKMRHEPLPRGIKLQYLSPIRPPTVWKGFHPPEDQLDHPVRGCTYNDFERFGVWSGMHIMTEFEYEYAARGADGATFPWDGDEFPLTSKLHELIVNWGSKVTKNYEPTTVPVHALPGGASRFGIFNLVGNVAEWTSSWFENYPKCKTKNQFLGRYVKVIRGGSGKDLETPVLRPAYRNWQGNDAKAPPYPYNGFPWVGTRMAAYLESGRDQLGPITRHVVRYKKVKEHHLNFDGFKGTVSNNWTAPGSEVTNHVYVLGKTASVVFIPTKSLLVKDRSLALQELWEKSRRVRKTSSFLKRSESKEPMFVLGVLHIDAPLANVLVPEPPEPPPAKGEKKKKKKKKKSGRSRRSKGPKTIKGTCPPGTYTLAFWHGQMCLTKPSMSFVCFLPPYPGQKWQAKVEKVKPADRIGTTLDIDTDLDEGPLKFQIDLGGEKPDDAYRVTVDLLLTFETGALEAAGNGTWLSNPRPPPPSKDGEGEDGADEDGAKDDAKKDDAGK